MTEHLPAEPVGAHQPHDVASDIVRVVRGEPDEMELAALVAGILTAASAARTAEPDLPAQPPWSDRARRLGATPRPGPGTWRWSLHP